MGVFEIIITTYIVGCVFAIITVYTDSVYLWVNGEENNLTIKDVIHFGVYSWIVPIVAIIIFISSLQITKKVLTVLDKPIIPKKTKGHNR